MGLEFHLCISLIMVWIAVIPLQFSDAKNTRRIWELEKKIEELESKVK